MRSTSNVCSSMKAWMKIVFTMPSPIRNRSSSASARSSGYIQRIVRAEVPSAIAGVGRRLKHQRENEIALEEQLDAITDLAIVDVLCDGGDDGGRNAGRFQIIESATLDGRMVAATPEDSQFL